jgi:hypothetical protein
VEHESLWWNHIAGASRYVNDVLGFVTSHRVLLLEEISFMSYFLQLLQEKMHQRDAGLQFEMSEADEWDGDSEIGELLMNRFVPESDYHPLDGSRIAYIAKHHLLQGRVLIVRNIDRVPKWLPAAIEYARHSGTRSGLLVLSYGGTCPLTAVRRGVAAPKWNAYITEYDMQLYASYCLAGREDLPSSLRYYITQLASRFSGYDPELCCSLANESIADDPEGVLSSFASMHETMSFLKYNLTDIHSIIWEAQVRTVFPIIERIRRRFIEKYHADLRDMLPQRDEFGKEIHKPEEMELRHMWYYYFKDYGFYSSEEGSEFQMASEARNKLAHLALLDSQTVREITFLDARFGTCGFQANA